MADDTIEVDVESTMLSVRVRNLISKATRNEDLLEFEPLRFHLDVPLPVIDKKGKKSPADAKSGKIDKAELEKVALKKMLQRVEKKVIAIVQQAKAPIESEIEKLKKQVQDLHKKDEKGDANAYKNANNAIKSAVARCEDLVDGIPATVRKAVEDEIKANASYEKQKLHTTGSWGFRTNKGIWLRSGMFQNVTGADEETGEELRKAMAAAKSAAGGSNPYDFVLAAGREAGIVIAKRVVGSDKKTAVERREGSGQVYFGEVRYKNSKYCFVLDKDCSVGQGAKLAKQIQVALKDATGKTYAIRVEGRGYGDEEAGED